MKEFSLAEETRLLEILEAVSPELLKFNGVHYLDIGYRLSTKAHQIAGHQGAC